MSPVRFSHEDIDDITFTPERIKNLDDFREGLKAKLEEARPFLEEGETEQVMRNFNRAVALDMIEDYVHANTLNHQQWGAFKSAEAKRLKAEQAKVVKKPAANKANALSISIEEARAIINQAQASSAAKKGKSKAMAV